MITQAVISFNFLVSVQVPLSERTKFENSLILNSNTIIMGKKKVILSTIPKLSQILSKQKSIIRQLNPFIELEISEYNISNGITFVKTNVFEF